MDCFKNIIGIIENTAIVSPPTDYNISTSGLYLLGGSENCIVKDGCETDYLLKQCDKAIKSAISQTIERLTSCVAEDYKQNVKKIDGWIGNKKEVAGIKELNNVMGIVISPNNVQNTTQHIDKLGIWVATAGSYVVKVWKNTTKINEFPVNVINAKEEVIFPVDITLDFYSDFEPVNYYISYELLGATPVYNHLFTCNCNTTAKKINENIRKYGDFAGFSAESEGTIEDARIYENTGFGIMIHSTLNCESKNIICHSYDSNDGFKAVLERAVYHKSIANLVRIIIDSKKIDQFTLLSHESLLGKISHHSKEWLDRVVGWMCGHVEVDGSGCFTCDDSRMRIVKG